MRCNLRGARSASPQAPRCSFWHGCPRTCVFSSPSSTIATVFSSPSSTIATVFSSPSSTIATVVPSTCILPRSLSRVGAVAGCAGGGGGSTEGMGLPRRRAAPGGAGTPHGSCLGVRGLPGRAGRDETCPVSTGEETRRVQLVREGREGGGREDCLAEAMQTDQRAVYRTTAVPPRLLRGARAHRSGPPQGGSCGRALTAPRASDHV